MNGVQSVVVLQLMVFSLCCLSAANGEVRLVQQSPLGFPCPGSEVVYRCTLPDTAVIWSFPGGEITLISTSNEGVSGNFRAQPVGVVSGNFTSTLTFSAENGTVITCNNGDRSRSDSVTITVQGPPSAPTLSCVDLSEDINGAVSVNLSWTMSGGDSAGFYLINITTNDPQPPYGGLLNITAASDTQRELTGFQDGYQYNTTIHGVNCGNQEGKESERLTITPQVPATPTSNVCAVYNMHMVTGALQIIESTWNEVEPVTVSVNCTNGQNIRASYELSYASSSGTIITTCVVNGTDCSDGICHHEVQNTTADSRCQPPMPQFNSESVTVTVTARNIVGRSNPAVSSVGGTNVNLGVSVDTSNPASVLVECTFEPGYTCTTVYGTDPSYTNFTYSDTSTTQDRVTTITLSRELQRDTTYYFMVSAESSSQCVRVRGKFRTGCLLTDLISADMVGVCADRGFANTLPISNGVVCFSRSTAGSKAVYVCDDGFNQDGAAMRVCQSGGVWNGSAPQCISVEPDANSNVTDGGVEALTTGAAVGIAVVTTAVVIFMAGVLTGALVYHCISKHRSQSSGSKPESSSHQQQQAGPQYEEVSVTSAGEKIELRRNMAYEPVQKIEMRENEAYGPIQH